MDNNIHNKHRERLRERFVKEGLDNFSEINALELLLFFCLPRIDTNPVAHELLNRFGSFAGVLDAPVEELKKVNGIGDKAAFFLDFIPQAARYYMASKEKESRLLLTSDDAIRYMRNLFIGQTEEIVYAAALDAKGKVITVQKLSKGSKNSSSLNGRMVAEFALSVGAQRIVLAHNHPGGLAIPSGDDLAVTGEVKKALSVLGVHLMDHIIVCDDDAVSLSQSGAL